MELRRSQRQPKPKTIWEERGAPSAARDPKITKKTDRTEQKTALKPVAIGPLPEALEFDVNQLPDLPAYEPPLKLQFEPSKSLLKDLSQLDTFQRLLTPAIIDRIVESTNSYAKNARETNPIDEDDFEQSTRRWKSVNATEIWRYIGCLFYMGYNRLSKHEEHWGEQGYLK